MRRPLRSALTLLALTALVLTGVPAGATTTIERSPDRDRAHRLRELAQRERPERVHHTRRVQRLELRCGALRSQRPAVGCTWSPSRHPEFARYQLVRSHPRVGRTVVATTAERRAVRAVDSPVRRGVALVYTVQALDHRGKEIGRSAPVRAMVR